MKQAVLPPENCDNPPVVEQAIVPLDCKVVALTHYLPPYMASVLLQLSRRVREFQVLLSIDQEPNRQFGDTWKGLNVAVQKSLMFRRPWKHDSGFRDELYIHVPYDTLFRLWRASPDVVFSYELGFRSFVSALYCKLFRKKLALCVCVSEHTERGRGRLRQFLRSFLLKWADAITYNGPSCRRYLKQFHVPDGKLFHFPYAATDEAFYSGPIERCELHDHRFMFIGQLSERKGILPFLRQLCDYANKRPGTSIEIDLVGTGPMQRGLEALELPANLKLNLLGHKSHREMMQLQEQAGILVFPTLADEWGLVVNEAMRAGMPVLGSRFAQACTTLIEEGENGWLYSPNSPEELEAKLDTILQTPHAALTRMRTVAVETVRDITPENVANKAKAMFQQLLG